MWQLALLVLLNIANTSVTVFCISSQIWRLNLPYFLIQICCQKMERYQSVEHPSVKMDATLLMV
jgi:membrane protein YqaA with SNARE-associated domain